MGAGKLVGERRHASLTLPTSSISLLDDAQGWLFEKVVEVGGLALRIGVGVTRFLSYSKR